MDRCCDGNVVAVTKHGYTWVGLSLSWVELDGGVLLLK